MFTPGLASGAAWAMPPEVSDHWEGATGEGATSVFQLEKELSHPMCGLQGIKAKQTKKKNPL